MGYGWQSAIHPHDRDRVLGSWSSFLGSGKPGDVEARLRRSDGEYRRFLCSAAPIAEASGRVIKWCGINTDIEERLQAQDIVRGQEKLKASEAELRQAYRYLAEAQRLSKTGSFTTDVTVDEHIWSEELYRIFEFELGMKISAQAVRAVVHPEDLPSFDVAFARSAAEGTDFDHVFHIVPASGRMKHLHCVAHLWERVEGRPVFIGAIQDVTERELAEQALNAARAELAHVARVMTLSALTASIAHEVNQPLSGIITNATTCLRMLAADPPNLEGARATAQRTLRDGNRASEVIQRLRALFARKQPGTEPVDLNDAAREVLALTSSELQSSRVILLTDLDDGLPDVRGDRVQLQQVILNLIVNAADAMKTVHDRPRHLHVATAREDANQVRLSVCDSGVGIDPGNVGKLFEAFYTTKNQGMGIGLSISRSIIESHGGCLRATANDGPGATFSLSLPCASSG